MRIWFDTEFIEDGKTIDLVSIGMVREDGAEYYAISSEFDADKASDWVREHVIAQLEPEQERRSRAAIASGVRSFAGAAPEFWAYYADYDWVVLCQLFGTMMDLPPGWPMYCRDIQQERDRLSVADLPLQADGAHNALADARWNRTAWEYLAGLAG